MIPVLNNHDQRQPVGTADMVDGKLVIKKPDFVDDSRYVDLTLGWIATDDGWEVVEISVSPRRNTYVA